MGVIVKGEQKSINDPYNIVVTREISAPATLSFSILRTTNEENANYKIGETFEYGGLNYLIDDIKENRTEQGVVTLDLSCLQDCINLSRKMVSKREYTDVTPAYIFKDVLTGTGWSYNGGDVNASITLSYSVNSRKTVMKVLTEVADKIDAVIIFEKNTIKMYKSSLGTLPINENTNIVTINTNSDTGDLLTRVYGYGAEDENKIELDISSANPTKLPYVENYSYFLNIGYTEQDIKNNPSVFIREGVYEDSSITDPKVLYNKTKEYLEISCKPTLDCELTLSLPNKERVDEIKLNMSRKIYDEQIGEYVPCRVTKITQDFNDELTLKLTLQSERKYGSYNSSLIIGQIDKIDDKVEYVWNNFLEEAKQNATDLINKGINGYVVVNGNEILIMDTDNKDTATHVWRWNSGGLGYSSTGYNGTFTTAITRDGSIVADVITTGNLNAKLIRAGILQSLNQRTWINMEDGSFNFYDKIKFTDGKLQINLQSGSTIEEALSSKVSSGDMGTLIEQNPYAVKIAWNNNSKYVQFEDGGLAIYNGAVSTSQKRAFFDEKGTHFWRDGNYLGKIGTNYYKADSSKKGIVFDLEYNGAYMSWGAKQTSTSADYTMMWTYANKTIGNLQSGMLHAGCDIDMHNYCLKNVAFEGGGITGTMRFVQVIGVNSSTGALSEWSNNCSLQFKNGILISGTWYSG